MSDHGNSRQVAKPRWQPSSPETSSGVPKPAGPRNEMKFS